MVYTPMAHGTVRPRHSRLPNRFHLTLNLSAAVERPFLESAASVAITVASAMSEVSEELNLTSG
jgi:hypothetical protein